MAVLSGIITQGEFIDITRRKDVTILKQRKVSKKEAELGLGTIHITLDCDFGVVEFLESIDNQVK